MTMGVSKKLTTQYAALGALIGCWKAGAPTEVLSLLAGVSVGYIVMQGIVDAVKAWKG